MLKLNLLLKNIGGKAVTYVVVLVIGLGIVVTLNVLIATVQNTLLQTVMLKKFLLSKV